MTTPLSETERFVLSVADDAINGRTCILEACRAIVPIRLQIRAIPDEILDPIIAVESELDDVPDSDAMPLWEPEALAKKLRERDAYLKVMHDRIIACFRALVSFIHAQSPPRA